MTMPLPSSLPLQQIVAEKKVNLQGEQNQTMRIEEKTALGVINHTKLEVHWLHPHHFSHLRFQLKPDFVDQKLIYAGELLLQSIS